MLDRLCEAACAVLAVTFYGTAWTLLIVPRDYPWALVAAIAAAVLWFAYTLDPDPEEDPDGATPA